MADKKISALTSATTPLAGTEVLPIVQSGVTVKSTVASMVDGRTISPLAAQLNGAGVSGSPISVNTNHGNFLGLGNAGWAQKSVLDTTYEADEDGVNLKVPSFGANSAVLRLNLAGNAIVKTGNLVIGTAGKGIDFSADPNASGMTSELLDDYEEGTFTPAFTASVSNPTVTYGLQRGAYCKVGGMVLVEVYMTWTAFSGGSGSVLINLPFTVLDNPGAGGSGAISSMNGVNLDSLRTYAAVSPQANAALANLRQLGSGSVSGNLAVGNMQTSGEIVFATTYRVK